MPEIRVAESADNIVYAYEPDKSLRKIIDENVPISSIFTADKIAECQKMVDDAKLSFFDTSQSDIDSINKIINASFYAENYSELCKQLNSFVWNIKGQADIFGFKLISELCKHLLEYFQQDSMSANRNDKDRKIVLQLAYALEKAFKEKITDSGGMVEKELIRVVSQKK